jgi:hypothetical protein
MGADESVPFVAGAVDGASPTSAGAGIWPGRARSAAFAPSVTAFMYISANFSISVAEKKEGGSKLTIVHSIILHHFIIQPRQPRHLAPHTNRIVNGDFIVAMHATLNAQPHDLGVLNLIYHAVEIVAEHARAHRLAARL